MNEIFATRSSLFPLEECYMGLKDIWDSHWLTNMGAKHKQLQAEMEEHLDVHYVALLLRETL